MKGEISIFEDLFKNKEFNLWNVKQNNILFN